MNLFDICVNLADKSFDKDRDAVLTRAAEAGVSHMLLPGSDLEDSKEHIKLVQDQQTDAVKMLTAVGYHPHQAKLWTEKSKASLATLIQEHATDGLIVAIGECGLDYNRNFSKPEQQRTAFSAQLELAKETGLPVFLHERDAHTDFAAILAEHRQDLAGALVHCFTGSREQLEHYLELDAHIGITGWFCDERRGKHLHELLPLIPPDKLMLETDAPYLLPRDLPKEQVNPANSRRNEPAYLAHLLSSIAGCLGKSPDTLAAETTANAMKFFRI